MRPVVKQHHSRVEWDQTAFEEMKAGWSPERIAEDEKLLQKIFDLAADSPLLAEALEWAEQHGVKFFVDRTVIGASGYYMECTGVIGISENCAKESTPAALAETLVHEIRHAWQEFHGMAAYDKSGTRSFTYLYFNQALREADAYAHGRRANHQIQAAREKRRGFPLPFFLKRDTSDRKLEKAFLDWFSSSFFTHHYGDVTSREQGKAWGVYSGWQKSYNTELPVPEKVPSLPGIDPYDRHDVLRLGAGFAGAGNYIAGFQPDALPKLLLPSLANTFWGSASRSERRLMVDLRKAHLRKKLASRRGLQACP